MIINNARRWSNVSSMEENVSIDKLYYFFIYLSKRKEH